MSNFTDGKNYLAAGNFAAAESKLIKALDMHPDDGRIWWALMLCRAECKTETELEKKLVAQYTAAAQSDGKPPENPVYGGYGKNALRYAPSDKYQSFANELNDKLDGIWQKYRGKSLKPPREIKREEKQPAKRARQSSGNTDGFEKNAVRLYIVVAAAVACGVLMCIGIGIAKTWLLWAGFALFAVMLIIAAVLIVLSNRAGKKIRGGTATALATGFVMEIIMTAIALYKADGAALIAGIIMLVLTAGVMAFVLLPMRKKGERDGGGKADKATKETGIVEKAKERLDNYNDSDD